MAELLGGVPSELMATWAKIVPERERKTDREMMRLLKVFICVAFKPGKFIAGTSGDVKFNNF